MPELEDVVDDKDRLKEFAEAVGRDVTADEIDPDDLTMTARVNGAEWSRGNATSGGTG